MKGLIIFAVLIGVAAGQSARVCCLSRNDIACKFPDTGDWRSDEDTIGSACPAATSICCASEGFLAKGQFDQCCNSRTQVCGPYTGTDPAKFATQVCNDKPNTQPPSETAPPTAEPTTEKPTIPLSEGRCNGNIMPVVDTEGHVVHCPCPMGAHCESHKGQSFCCSCGTNKGKNCGDIFTCGACQASENNCQWDAHLGCLEECTTEEGCVGNVDNDEDKCMPMLTGTCWNRCGLKGWGDAEAVRQFNPFFLALNRDKDDAGTSCHCDEHCEEDHTCCSDYEFYCNAM